MPKDLVIYIKPLFLRLSGFQQGLSRANIEAQPIPPTAGLTRDTNN